MKRKVGDYEWKQLSMWDFAESGTVEKFVKSNCGQHIFHYELIRITEMISENGYKYERVTSLEGVPDEVLKWSGSNYRIKP